MNDVPTDFGSGVPAWRARRLRAHLAAQAEAGRAARGCGEARAVPDELEHRAEVRSWLAGWDSIAETAVPAPPAPTPKQIARIERWRSGAGRLKAADGELRSAILEAVADEFLAERPLPHGAIARAHRETVRRCREVGLPGPRSSRYRKWLKLSRGV